MADWNAEKHSLDFIVQLGDIIDGMNWKLQSSTKALDDVLQHFSKLQCDKVIHVIGNHELYNFDRETLRDRLLKPWRQNHDYFSVSPVPGIKFVVIDAYDVSTIGAASEEYRSLALEILKANNPNDTSKNGDWKHGLEGVEKRFVPYNGGVGNEQLKWLEQELAEAEEAGQVVIVLSHISVHPESCSQSCLVWNYQDLLQMFQSSSCVVAVFSGHDHKGGYALDEVRESARKQHPHT